MRKQSKQERAIARLIQSTQAEVARTADERRRERRVHSLLSELTMLRGCPKHPLNDAAIDRLVMALEAFGYTREELLCKS